MRPLQQGRLASVLRRLAPVVRVVRRERQQAAGMRLGCVQRTRGGGQIDLLPLREQVVREIVAEGGRARRASLSGGRG